MLIGAIVAAWSSTEMVLASYYAELLFGRTPMGEPLPQGQWAAMETFDMLVSFQQRRAMLIGAAERRGFDATLMAQFKKCLQALQDAANTRVISAHGRWSICDDFPDALIWQRNIGSIQKALIYEPVDFEKDLAKIVQADGNISELFRVSFVPVLEASAKAYIAHIRAPKQVQGSV